MEMDAHTTNERKFFSLVKLNNTPTTTRPTDMTALSSPFVALLLCSCAAASNATTADETSDTEESFFDVYTVLAIVFMSCLALLLIVRCVTQMVWCRCAIKNDEEDLPPPPCTTGCNA